MRLRNALYFAAFFGLSAAGASAQDRADRFPQRDGNGDGVLTPHEYQTTGGHPGNFRALDTNGDGVLSYSEFVGRGGAVEDQAYARDRAYEQERAAEQARAAEAARANEAVRVDRASRARASRSRGRSGDGVAVRTSQRAPAGSSFDVKDRNRDGLLTRAEYGDRRTFTRVDRNRDARISYEEFLNPPAR